MKSKIILLALTSTVLRASMESGQGAVTSVVPDYCETQFFPQPWSNPMKVPYGQRGFVNKNEISPTVMMFGYDNLGKLVDGKGRCETYVENAAKRGGHARKIMFVPTAYFNPTQAFLQTYSKKERLNHNIPLGWYCFDNSQEALGATVEGNCAPPTWDQIKVFEQTVTRCMAKMVEYDFEIFIAPHLDDGISRHLYMWRNALDFAPENKYGDFTYDQFMIQPLLNAIKATKPRKVKFALVGEMSVTLTKNAAAWTKYMNRLKRTARVPGVDMKFGMTTNYKSIFGATSYKSLPFNPKVFNKKAIRELFNTVEFYGISAYPEQPNTKTIDPFTPAKMAEYELNQVGLSLNDFAKTGREFHYTEYGIGGGGDNTCGRRPASSVKEMVTKPFATIFWDFISEATNPWNIPALNDYRQWFHRASWRYWSGEKKSPFKIDGVFLWSLNTFDFQVISGEMKGITYDDKGLALGVQCHNAKIYGIQDNQCKA